MTFKPGVSRAFPNTVVVLPTYWTRLHCHMRRTEVGLLFLFFICTNPWFLLFYGRTNLRNSVSQKSGW